MVLAGHSLGGICIALYAIQHPGTVHALAPLGTVVSGQLSTQSPQYAHGELQQWEKTGWRMQESRSRPGVIKKLKWSHMVDRLQYDVLPEVHKLTMPVLLVTGELDTSCPPAHQQILFDVLPVGKKELHIIPGAPHTFRDPVHLQQLKTIFEHWIRMYL